MDSSEPHSLVIRPIFDRNNNLVVYRKRVATLVHRIAKRAQKVKENLYKTAYATLARPLFEIISRQAQRNLVDQAQEMPENEFY